MNEAFPFRLNTGRVRDQWHTMTRTGLSPRLGAHLPEPFVEVHPSDAAKLGLNNGGFARLRSVHGDCVLKVRISDGQQPGSLFAPIHWSRTTSSSSHVGDLVAPETDPFSGQPEAKATPVSIAPVEFASHGFALTRDPIEQPPDAWWCRVAVKGGHGLLLAGEKELAAWRDTAAKIFSGRAAEYIDEARGLYRAALFVDGRLEGCLSVGSDTAPPAWDSMKALFEAQDATPVRRIVLSGKSADGIADPGPLICACFGVGANTIRAAIEGGAKSVDDVGIALKAGTNCGSCLPELKRMLSDEATAASQLSRSRRAWARWRGCRCSLRSRASARWSPAAAPALRGRSNCCLRPVRRSTFTRQKWIAN